MPFCMYLYEPRAGICSTLWLSLWRWLHWARLTCPSMLFGSWQPTLFFPPPPPPSIPLFLFLVLSLFLSLCLFFSCPSPLPPHSPSLHFLPYFLSQLLSYFSLLWFSLSLSALFLLIRTLNFQTIQNRHSTFSNTHLLHSEVNRNPLRVGYSKN